MYVCVYVFMFCMNAVYLKNNHMYVCMYVVVSAIFKTVLHGFMSRFLGA